MAADGFPVALDAVTSACCGFGRVERANQEALSGVYYTKAGARLRPIGGDDYPHVRTVLVGRHTRLRRAIASL